MNELSTSDMIAMQVMQVLLIAAAIPAILFPILYFFRSPWRSTVVGKMMMTKSSAIGLVFTLSLLFRFVPAFPGKYWIAAGAYGYLAFALWFQTRVLIGIQHNETNDADCDRTDVGQSDREDAM